MIDKSAPPRRQVSHLRIFAAAAAGVIVAVLAGIYGIGRLQRNPAAGRCKGALATAFRIAPLARGEVAALIVTHTPFRVPDLTFKDAAGRTRMIEQWRGRTVLLNLWATWCVPCRREIPALDALEAQLGGPHFEVVAVNIDTGDPNKPRAFLSKVGATHLAYYADDSAKVFQELKMAGRAFGLPTTLLVGRSGCEIGEMAGPAAWASDDAIKLLRAALGTT